MTLDLKSRPAAVEHAWHLAIDGPKYADWRAIARAGLKPMATLEQ